MIINDIIEKIRKFQTSNYKDRIKKIIIGRLDWEDVRNRISPVDIYCKSSGGLEILGFEVTVSKRDRYIRVIPENLKYITRRK